MNSTFEIIPAKTREFVGTIESGLERYRDFSVVNKAEADGAGAELASIKRYMKEVDTVRRGITKPMDEAKKNVMGFFKPITEKLKAAEASVKDALVRYHEKVEADRRALQAKLAIAAREQEKRSREALDRMAKKELAEGDTETAREILEQKEALIVTPPKIDAEKHENVSYRTTWHFEVTDFSLLPDEYKKTDDMALRGVATALKDKAQVPGVRFWAEKIAVSRS